LWPAARSPRTGSSRSRRCRQACRKALGQCSDRTRTRADRSRAGARPAPQRAEPGWSHSPRSLEHKL